MSFNEKMKAIANNIRAKTGGMQLINLDAMADGVNEVYDKGRIDEWSDFWDTFQDYGKRTNYGYAFSDNSGEGWTDRSFKPKYDIKPTDFERAMRRSRITNLEESIENCGVIFDTSRSTTLQLAFSGMANLEVLPTIDLSGVTDINGADATFSYTPKLHTIRKLIMAENINPSSAFVSCISLKNIIVEGVIGRSISFPSSPLTVESMKSIISCLKDYSGTSNAGAYTLTLKDECKKAMANLGAITEFNNKTYDAYLTDIGWNLA